MINSLAYKKVRFHIGLLSLPPFGLGIQLWVSHRTLGLVVTLPCFLSRPVKLYVWTEEAFPGPSCMLAVNGMAGLFLGDDTRYTQPLRALAIPVTYRSQPNVPTETQTLLIIQLARPRCHSLII